MAKKKKKFYAVARGRKPGIYTEWFGPGGAMEQVKDFKGAVYKGFFNRTEAEAFCKNPPIRPWEQSASAKKIGPKKNEKSKPVPGPEVPKDAVIIYTDGCSLGNPGPGGYGVVIIDGKTRREISKGFSQSTNNRMELSACIHGLSSIEKPSRIILYSDSKYVVDGMTKGWARRWKKKGWMRTKTEPAKNADLWERLLDLCEKHEVTFVWVRGHAGNPENERCDQLANQAAMGSDLSKDYGYTG